MNKHIVLAAFFFMLIYTGLENRAEAAAKGEARQQTYERYRIEKTPLPQENRKPTASNRGLRFQTAEISRLNKSAETYLPAR